MASVKSPLPATALEGVNWLRLGTGFITVNVSAGDVPPPGFVTVTGLFPVLLINEVKIVVLTCVESTSVVV